MREHMTLRRCLPFLVLTTAWLGAAADDSSYTGASSCASCHPAQAALQAQSAHARSLRPAAEHPLASAFASSEWLAREPNFRLRYRRAGGQIRAQGYDERNTMDIAVEWAFGAGEQAVTLVTRIDKDWHLEHHFSYYTALGRMAPTAGHAVLQPKTLPEAMGVPYKTLDPNIGILGCFECHSTGLVQISKENVLNPQEAGVRCEACHGPGREHVQTASRGKAGQARALIGNPGRGSAADLLVKCGSCHRPPAGPNTQIDWSFSWNVRHQPVYLAQSKCMTKSDGKLSCLTCHDPHGPLKNSSAASYNQRCQSCHGEGACRSGATTGCTTCHMPKVFPQPGLRFTNHWIGTYDPAKPLRPR